MNLSNFSNASPLQFNQEVISKAIVGIYEKDRWSTNDFPKIKENWTRPPRWLVFESIQNSSIKNEIKYYFCSNIKNESMSPSTLWSNYGLLTITLGNFFSDVLPSVNSIIELPLEEFIDLLRNYLLSIGKTVEKKRYLTESNLRWQSQGISESNRLTAARSIYNFLFNLYDYQPEIEKDRWDVRKLGLDFNITDGCYAIDFSLTPKNFRGLSKRYIKERLIEKEDFTWSTAIRSNINLRVFLIFITEKYPHWNNLKQLSRSDILCFIDYLRKQPMGGNSAKAGQISSDKYIYRTYSVIHVFLQYIQLMKYDEAPDNLINTLIHLSKDLPRQKRRKEDSILYIPDHIWEQIINNIEFLAKDTIPIILILEATGFRICDVLQLKQDCLLEQDDGYWVQGIQRKVKHANHKVPISNEIADMIKSQITYINKFLPSEDNSGNYLFPVLKGKKKGIPPLNSTVTRRLNNMAFKCNIKDHNGEIYWFKSHGFRHRFGVNLVNNGMNIIHIQKLMAHSCLEITLHYATIHDKTLREAWERANNAIVSIDAHGFIVPANLESYVTNNGLELEWIRHNLDSIRLEHGYCIKIPHQQCDYLETTLDPPCIKNKCRSFHVDQTFIDYYQHKISEMESDIKIYKETNRIRSIEIIQPKLDKYRSIVDKLINNESIQGMQKKQREFTEIERSNN
jgi:integrase